MFLGLSAAGACGAAMPEPDPLAKSTPKENAGSETPKCPHGALEDPHRGFIRCLRPDEVDAGWLPPAPQPEPPANDAGTDAAPPPDAGPPDAAPEKPAPEKPVPEKPAPVPEKPQPPPMVTVVAPKFEGGEVPRAEKFVNDQLEGIAKCVATNGGLEGKTGSVKVTFLVRARGRAEGVEVATRKGINDDAASCIRLLLKNKAVGAPSADPVGVTVTFKLERAK